MWLPGHYKDLVEHKGIAAAYPVVQQQRFRVEVRSLNFYDYFLKVGEAHG